MVPFSTSPILGELLTASPLGSTDFVRTAVHDPAVITDALIELDDQMGLQPGAQAASLRTLRGLCSPFGQKKSQYGVHVSRLASIRNLVLVTWGRLDRVIPVARAEVAAKGLPNVRVRNSKRESPERRWSRLAFFKETGTIIVVGAQDSRPRVETACIV